MKGLLFFNKYLDFLTVKKCIDSNDNIWIDWLESVNKMFWDLYWVRINGFSIIRCIWVDLCDFEMIR